MYAAKRVDIGAKIFKISLFLSYFSVFEFCQNAYALKLNTIAELHIYLSNKKL